MEETSPFSTDAHNYGRNNKQDTASWDSFLKKNVSFSDMIDHPTVDASEIPSNHPLDV